MLDELTLVLNKSITPLNVSYLISLTIRASGLILNLPLKNSKTFSISNKRICKRLYFENSNTTVKYSQRI